MGVAEMTVLITCDKCGFASTDMSKFERVYAREVFDLCEPCTKEFKTVKETAIRDWLNVE
jgi:hypothetical protein